MKKTIFAAGFALFSIVLFHPTTYAHPVSADCSFNGKSLFGKVQVVQSFADVKVQVVQSFPDLKVQWVQSFPDQCGKWQRVESFPDLKIQFVQSFPDVKIKMDPSFPGLP